MTSNRREFLQQSGLTLAATGLAAASTASAASAPAANAKGMAKSLTLMHVMRDGKPRLHVRTQQGILDVVEAGTRLNMGVPSSIDELLQHEDGPRLNALVAAVDQRDKSLYKSEAGVVYGPVVTRPDKIVCVGLNYAAHAAEGGNAVPKVPVLFNKYNNTLNAHQAKIPLPTAIATKFDYEVELVVLMGRRAHNVTEAEALSYVAGYSVGNDLTARELQRGEGGQWMIGKSLDNFGPIGPYFVTADQIDPNNLAIECRVNGQTRQSSHTKLMIFNCAKLISYISKHITLKPGDVIFSGTPDGVISGYPVEKQVWLKAGDKIACSVEKLGELQFQFV